MLRKTWCDDADFAPDSGIACREAPPPGVQDRAAPEPELDELDRCVVHALQIRPRAPWTLVGGGFILAGLALRYAVPLVVRRRAVFELQIGRVYGAVREGYLVVVRVVESLRERVGGAELEATSTAPS